MATIAAFTWGETGAGTSITQTEGRWVFWNLTYTPGAVTSIRIRLTFNSGDGTSNTYAGWCFDSFKVTCDDLLLPAAPTNVTPLAGATLVSPPGVPLDCTDATDTSACGPGAVLEYQFQVDDDSLFGTPVFTGTSGISAITTPTLAAGTWNWRVRARDDQFNYGPYSTPTSFIVEAPALPSAPDTLFVNEDYNGAQTGRSGFVSPVIDETPVFSAVYRDPNTIDNAIQLEYQVSDDPLFMVLTTSGILTLPALLPKDTRCPDFTISSGLNKDTTYYWRCRFSDSLGFGSWSLAQSFRIGDGYDFGERPGSENHSRKCWVATSAYGSESASPVVALQSWRSQELERFSAGRLFSRAYHVTGRAAAPSVAGSGVVRLAVGSVASVAGIPAAAFSIAVLALLAALGLGRFSGR